MMHVAAKRPWKDPYEGSKLGFLQLGQHRCAFFFMKFPRKALFLARDFGALEFSGHWKTICPAFVATIGNGREAKQSMKIQDHWVHGQSLAWAVHVAGSALCYGHGGEKDEEGDDAHNKDETNLAKKATERTDTKR